MKRKEKLNRKERDAYTVDAYAYLREMDTPLLEQMLRQIEEVPGGFDPAPVAYILDILLEREGGMDPVQVEQSLAQFKERYAVPARRMASPRPKFRFSRLSVAMIIIIALLAGATAAYGFGFDFFGFLLHPGPDVTTVGGHVEIVSRSEGHSSDSDVSIEPPDTVRYASISEALTAFGADPRLPAVIPEPFELQSVEVTTMGDMRKLVIHYSAGDKTLVILADKGFSIYAYENNDKEGLPYVVGKTEHFIISNMEQQVAIWTQGDILLTMHGDVSLEEMKALIDSMYGG